MENSSVDKDFIDRLLIQGLSDELEIGWLVVEAHRMFPSRNNVACEALVLQSVFYLLSQDFMEIGDFHRARHPKWLSWEGSAKEKIRRIELEWQLLAREPQFGTGEIGWLFLTEKGIRVAHQLNFYLNFSGK